MEFEWNAEKAHLNMKKHGISFQEASRVFFDFGRLEMYDGREDYGEDRWAVIGMVRASMLYVVYTIREHEIIRIISARKANAQEKKQYRQANA